MPKTLSREEIYWIIQRELPDSVFASSSNPSQFYTTSEDDSLAVVLETAYSNLARIYENYFPQTTDEYIDKWETFVFNEISNAASGLQFRRDRVLTKIRSKKGITKQDIIDLVLLVIGSDKTIEILEYSGPEGSWILDYSELEKNTYLSGFSTNTALLSGPDLWLKTAAQLGLTDAELAQYKKDAYGYTVRIINYNATATELAMIEALLTKYEPARSWHQIENNATLEDAKYEWLLDFSELESNTYI